MLTEFEYTDRGQLALEATEYDSTCYEVEYTYDAAGNIDTVTTPAGTLIDYTYAGARVSEVDVTYGTQTETIENLVWLPFGPLEDADFPAGAELRRTFNKRYQLETLVVKDSATPTPNTLVDREFKYDYTAGAPGPDDPGPNLDRAIDNLDSAESHFYFYDELDRLDKVTDLSGTTQFDYAYDSAGNRTQKVNSAGTTNYTFETGTNRLASATGAEAAYFANDAYGNRIYEGATAYSGTPNHTYNDQNRLVSAPDANGNQVAAVYDAFGRRIAWNTFVFAYDQAGRVLEVSSEFNGSGWFGDLIWVEGELLGRVEDNVVVGDPAWIPPAVRPWLPGPRFDWAVMLGSSGLALLVVVGIRQRRPRWAAAAAAAALVLVVGIACTPTGVAFYWIVTDHIGKPIAMTDTPTSGDPVVVWKASYAPFGEATEDLDPDGDSKNIRMPVRFPGQFWDFLTGYHYNFFRDYDPQTGRYLEADPIGQGGGYNLYAYVVGNPLNLKDPLGLIWETTRADHHVAQSLVQRFLNLFARQGFERPTEITDPELGAGSTRDLFQTWVRDPENPAEDCRLPIGTKRRIPQTLTTLPPNYDGPPVLTDPSRPNNPFWSPPVAPRTYDDVPGQEVFVDDPFLESLFGRNLERRTKCQCELGL